jgi:hypothetical protein
MPDAAGAKGIRPKTEGADDDFFSNYAHNPPMSSWGSSRLTFGLALNIFRANLSAIGFLGRIGLVNWMNSPKDSFIEFTAIHRLMASRRVGWSSPVSARSLSHSTQYLAWDPWPWLSGLATTGHPHFIRISGILLRKVVQRPHSNPVVNSSHSEWVKLPLVNKRPMIVSVWLEWRWGGSSVDVFTPLPRWSLPQQINSIGRVPCQ